MWWRQPVLTDRRSARPSVLSGPVNPDTMPNGDGLTAGLGAAGGGTLPNGSLLPAAAPQSSSSPISPPAQGPPAGVGSHAPHPPVQLAKSEGGSAEAVAVHATDSLQSLRLSMPMQETELCKHISLRAAPLTPLPPPPPHLIITIITWFYCGVVCILK